MKKIQQDPKLAIRALLDPIFQQSLVTGNNDATTPNIDKDLPDDSVVLEYDCEPCIGNCDFCVNGKSCSKCQDGFHILKVNDDEKKCVKECPACHVVEGGSCVPNNSSFACRAAAGNGLLKADPKNLKKKDEKSQNDGAAVLARLGGKFTPQELGIDLTVPGLESSTSLVKRGRGSDCRTQFMKEYDEWTNKQLVKSVTTAESSFCNAIGDLKSAEQKLQTVIDGNSTIKTISRAISFGMLKGLSMTLVRATSAIQRYLKPIYNKVKKANEKIEKYKGEKFCQYTEMAKQQLNRKYRDVCDFACRRSLPTMQYINDNTPDISVSPPKINLNFDSLFKFLNVFYDLFNPLYDLFKFLDHKFCLTYFMGHCKWRVSVLDVVKAIGRFVGILDWVIEKLFWFVDILLKPIENWIMSVLKMNFKMIELPNFNFDFIGDMGLLLNYLQLTVNVCSIYK